MYSESNRMFPILQTGFESGLRAQTQALITGPGLLSGQLAETHAKSRPLTQETGWGGND